MAAFAIDQQSGALTHINTESTVGPGPCHISIDRAGKYALAANYGGGSVAILPIREDGSLGPATDFVQHEGSSVNPGRQEGPHAHSIMVAPNNKHAFAPDLGIDKVLIYAIDHEMASWSRRRRENRPGSGPRHLAFHPDSQRAYVINELSNTITAFDYDADAGTLATIQTISTLPDGYEEVSPPPTSTSTPTAASYGSNRGHDSIASMPSTKPTANSHSSRLCRPEVPARATLASTPRAPT